MDISAEALKIAEQSAKKNNVFIHFFEADILNLNELQQSFNIIVSNPPYVRASEKLQMQQNVLANEPHLALFVEDNNALLYYDKIANLAKKQLAKSRGYMSLISEGSSAGPASQGAGSNGSIYKSIFKL